MIFRPNLAQIIQHERTSGFADMKLDGASRSQGALSKMWGRQITGSSTNFHRMFGVTPLILFSFSILLFVLSANVVGADDNQQNADVLMQEFSLGSEDSTTEFGKHFNGK